ncbi:hypothetical protein [Microcoleus sp. FACHB-672]|uniref:hypothetical protein n=1 Tax=Microcoleus sp. FACHB-672 TaxID=2692825 RepID=UPI00168833FB|nr:hypothetical protein [Microcoleus sp. FACHB-672]MBD2041326.1 hypothetical protein [Microcoleus sp. FACHB-672]
MKPASINCAGPFQPSQIICLEHQNSYLYAEVIDIIEARQMCWGRPIMLAVWLAGIDRPSEGLFEQLPELYDLRDGADFLLPISLFRPALDTELIPLLPQLDIPPENKPVDAPKIAHRQLREFIHQIWQAYPTEFQV